MRRTQSVRVLHTPALNHKCAKRTLTLVMRRSGEGNKRRTDCVIGMKAMREAKIARYVQQNNGFEWVRCSFVIEMAIINRVFHFHLLHRQRARAYVHKCRSARELD